MIRTQRFEFDTFHVIRFNVVKIYRFVNCIILSLKPIGKMSPASLLTDLNMNSPLNYLIGQNLVGPK